MVSAREEAASLNNNPKKVQSEEMKFKVVILLVV